MLEYLDLKAAATFTDLPLILLPLMRLATFGHFVVFLPSTETLADFIHFRVCPSANNPKMTIWRRLQ